MRLSSFGLVASALCWASSQVAAQPCDGNCVPSCVAYEAWIANASTGDVILTASPHGVVGQLLGSLGQVHSHSATVSTRTDATAPDGSTVATQVLRHNTLDEGTIELSHDGLMPSSLNPDTLRDGKPGMSSIAPSGDEVGIVLSGAAETEWMRLGAAATLDSMAGFYRFFSYTSIDWRDPFNASADDGNMCAGSIYWAHHFASEAEWPVRHYSASVRDPAAQTLHDIMVRKVLAHEDGLDWLEKVGATIFGFLEGDSPEELAEHAANQVVNCMAFDDCARVNRRWAQGVGDGDSLAPDDLLDLVGSDGFPFSTAAPIEALPTAYLCSP